MAIDRARWAERWDAFWFPPASPLNLAVARIVAAAAQLFWFYPSLRGQINLATKNETFLDPQPIIRAITAVLPREVLFSADGLTVLHTVTFWAGAAALIGLFTRASLLVFALGIWVLVSHAYSYADIHHPEALFAIFLLVLAFAPSGARLSVDALVRRRRDPSVPGVADSVETADNVMWPLKLLHVLMAATYFSTGAAKLISGGLTWMNGYTLQNYVFSDAVSRDIPLGIWLAQHYWLCVILGIGTILFEVFYFVSLFMPRMAPLFFIGGIFFHIGLWATSGHPFFPHITMNFILLLCLDREWLPALLGRPRISGARSRPQTA